MKKYIVQAEFTNRPTKTRIFATEKALNRWSNAQYSKDSAATVKVYDYITSDLVMEIHA